MNSGVAQLKDVAARAGVSTSTASLILNGKTESFTDATIERVRATATELGYRPNRLAQSLRSRRTNTIGFISDEIALTPFAGAMVRGALEGAWKAGHVLVHVDTEGSPDMERAAIESLLDRQVDGLLYARMYHQVVVIPGTLGSLPLVLLDARDQDGTVPSVVPDEAGGITQAVEHLLEAGHRRIGYVDTVDDVPAAHERRAAFRAALAGAGLTDPPIVTDRLEAGQPSDAVDRLLAAADRPTALSCFNDLTALRAYNAARRAGLSIPDDVSIVGFDNLETVAPWLDPGLTTVQLPHYEMGRWAVERLESVITGGEGGPEQRRLHCPLVTRASVAPPPRYNRTP
jgi:LacI family transcriptional regulator